MSETIYDALVIGGGPGGATAAYVLAKANRRVLLVEKTKFPRFHIGESILPCAFPLIQELGLESAFRKIPYVEKLGAEFGMGNDPNTTRFTFDSALFPGSWTFNIERSVFDKMLLDEARAAGAEVRESTSVRQINRLQNEDCQATLDSGETVRGRYILDASGHGCVVGRHLNIRKPIPNPDLHKVAHFEHFQNVERLPGSEEGNPGIIIADEGWFWLIAINKDITSVGFVCHPDFHKSIGVAPTNLLAWAVERCPVVRHRLRNSGPVGDNRVIADFSYTCKPCAGAGYFLVGDAGCFIDPIFSTGVSLAMKSAKFAADQLLAIFQKQVSPAAAQRRYIRYVEGSTHYFWHMIRNFYKHSFRELFLEGRGPCNVQGAVISVLAGEVFPRPPWALRWRLWLFDLCMLINQVRPLVPPRKHFSLLANNAGDDQDISPLRPPIAITSPALAKKT